jgi:hypothetical protein
MLEQPMNLQRIINCLRHNRYLCDDCISVESGVRPRQAVNRLCRENFHLINECNDRACEGQCGKRNKILRYIPQQNTGVLGENQSNITGAIADGATANPTVDELLGDTEPAANRAPDQQEITDAEFSRRKYLHGNFNEIIQRAISLPPADYLGRLSLEGLMDLKAITSNIHAVITLRLTFALVDWLEKTLNLPQEQARVINDVADAAKPFESGFDLDSENPNIIGEVKGNIPVRGGSVFGAAQVKGLTNDARQMFGLPPIGKTAETMSPNSKIHRPKLSEALKFLAVYDSQSVREAAVNWMASFQNAHKGRKVKLAEGVTNFDSDTVYVVFLTLDDAPHARSVEIGE